MGSLLPPRDLGQLLGSYLHREQSIGEARGLRRLEAILDDRKYDLQVKLSLITPEKPLERNETSQEENINKPL